MQARGKREDKNKSHSKKTPTTPTATPIDLFLVSGLGIPRYNPSIQRAPICCSSSSPLPPKTSLEPAPLRDFPESGYGIKVLQVSVGYFLADLAMIVWSYPSLGGMEYVLHHTLSVIAVAYTMLSGEGQFYTYLVLISEITTPGINLRWFLDTAGMKRSKAYLVNGAMVFLAWLVARILLFIYLFYHIFLHYDQVRQMHSFGCLLIFVVPSALAIMNIIWFGKILKGLRKALSKGK
ncbi:transmembrane protein 56-B-like [Musa troglodytarum]|uniref:Transmembrane protein 56-B-like n=1 Tax=Musa troglodytarum TaxID=320322 RepID=A0A9E7H6K2_9LILI|nr:transmembrane protein 56-B-like [Musa troglodytarum]